VGVEYKASRREGGKIQQRNKEKKEGGAFVLSFPSLMPVLLSSDFRGWKKGEGGRELGKKKRKKRKKRDGGVCFQSHACFSRLSLSLSAREKGKNSERKKRRADKTAGLSLPIIHYPMPTSVMGGKGKTRRKGSCWHCGKRVLRGREGVNER